jgi:NitT/TauT family transport system ATP-binding protein
VSAAVESLSAAGLAEEKPSARPRLTMRNIGQQFDNGTLALQGFDLTVTPGSFVSLVGASGCGKSTVLRLIAGLTSPTTGGISWSAGTDERNKPPGMSYVFQEPTLMPWSSALTNVMLPLKLAGVPKKEAVERAQEALAAVGLGPFAPAYPRQLSGGMKMRVSLARAVVTQPDLLLLDEPFAALDEITRFKLTNDLAELWRSRGFTTIFVTHSVFESVYLSQRVVIMAARPGRVLADLPIEADTPRTEAFRLSAAYAELCRVVSAKLQEAMRV